MKKKLISLAVLELWIFGGNLYVFQYLYLQASMV